MSCGGVSSCKGFCSGAQLVHSQIGKAIPFVGRENSARDAFVALKLEGTVVLGDVPSSSLSRCCHRPAPHFAGRALACLGGSHSPKFDAPVGIILGGPGVGKSTLAERLGVSVTTYAAAALAASNPAAALFARDRCYQVNVMIGNGSNLLGVEKAQLAERSLAVRVLWQAFWRDKFPTINAFYACPDLAGAPAFSFEDVVGCIAHAQPGSSPLFLVVVLDEAQSLVCRQEEYPFARPEYVYIYVKRSKMRHHIRVVDRIEMQVAPGDVGTGNVWCPHEA